MQKRNERLGKRVEGRELRNSSTKSSHHSHQFRGDSRTLPETQSSAMQKLMGITSDQAFWNQEGKEWTPSEEWITSSGETPEVRQRHWRALDFSSRDVLIPSYEPMDDSQSSSNISKRPSQFSDRPQLGMRLRPEKNENRKPLDERYQVDKRWYRAKRSSDGDSLDGSASDGSSAKSRDLDQYYGPSLERAYWENPGLREALEHTENVNNRLDPKIAESILNVAE